MRGNWSKTRLIGVGTLLNQEDDVVVVVVLAEEPAAPSRSWSGLQVPLGTWARSSEAIACGCRVGVCFFWLLRMSENRGKKLMPRPARVSNAAQPCSYCFEPTSMPSTGLRRADSDLLLAVYIGAILLLYFCKELPYNSPDNLTESNSLPSKLRPPRSPGSENLVDLIAHQKIMHLQSNLLLHRVVWNIEE